MSAARVNELFRVNRPGGCLEVVTAARRRTEARLAFLIEERRRLLIEIDRELAATALRLDEIWASWPPVDPEERRRAEWDTLVRAAWELHRRGRANWS
jgi:hypothetical protein